MLTYKLEFVKYQFLPLLTDDWIFFMLENIEKKILLLENCLEFHIFENYLRNFAYVKH